MNINTKVRIFIKIYLKNGRTIKYSSSKTKRIFLLLSKQENFKKAYLKVNYGKEYDASGKYDEFYNDGEYASRNELIKALRAFLDQ